MIKFFSKYQPLYLISLLPIILALVWLPNFLFPKANVIPISNIATPIFDLITNIVDVESIYMRIVAIILVYLQAIWFANLVNSQEIFRNKNYLPALFFVLLMSSYPALQKLNPILLANFFIIPVFQQLKNLYLKKSIKTELFLMGFLTGLASLVYFPYVIFSLFVFLSLIIFRTPSLRQLFIILLGLAFPYYWFYSVLFLLDIPFNIPGENIEVSISFIEIMSGYNWKDYIYFVFGSVFFVLSFFRILAFNTNRTVIVKNFINSYLVFLVISFLSLFWIKKYPVPLAGMIVFPFSVFLSNFFINQKKPWFAEMLFWIIVAVVFVYNL